MKIDFTGVNVLVTGSSRGIGRAIARVLGEAGARVAIHCRSRIEDANRVAGELRDATVFQADLADMSQVRGLFDSVIDAFGRLDVLINNAGIAVKVSPSETGPEWDSTWDQTLNVNLKAPALLSQLAVEHFRSRGGGRIVSVSSRAAFRGDTVDYLAYAASKAGIVAFTRSVARGFGKEGIRAFVVAPGFTRTDMADEFIDLYGERHASGDIALERLTEPADVANVVAFLASGLADHATGCTVDVNAGSYLH